MRNFVARLKRHRVSIMRANPYAYRLDRLQHRLHGVVFYLDAVKLVLSEVLL